MSPRYTIGPDGASITCHTCDRTSHNPGDVQHLYCGHCYTFHPHAQMVEDHEKMKIGRIIARTSAPPGPLHASFDPEDQALITAAWKRYKAGEPITGKWTEVVDCIAFATRQFALRLLTLPFWPMHRSNWVFTFCQPTTFFDKFIIDAMMADIATSSGFGVDVRRMQRPKGNKDPKWGRCPDVIFEKS